MNDIENKKAKEIINEILEYFRNNTITYPYSMLEVLCKAEQFLKGDKINMSFSKLLKQENVDLSDKEKFVLLQKFYQEGYMQGVNDKNPNYEYSLKYMSVVTRLLELFNKTINPICLEQLEKGLDVMDKYYKENFNG